MTLSTIAASFTVRATGPTVSRDGVAGWPLAVLGLPRRRVGDTLTQVRQQPQQRAPRVPRIPVLASYGTDGAGYRLREPVDCLEPSGEGQLVLQVEDLLDHQATQRVIPVIPRLTRGGLNAGVGSVPRHVLLAALLQVEPRLGGQTGGLLELREGQALSLSKPGGDRCTCTDERTAVKPPARSMVTMCSAASAPSVISSFQSRARSTSR